MHPRQLAKHIILEDQSDLARGCRRYLEWMAIKNYSPTTIENRRYTLNYYLYWTRQNNLTEAALTQKRPIQIFADYLEQRTKAKERPINQRRKREILQQLKSLYKYLSQNALIPEDPSVDIPLPKTKTKTDYQIPNHEQIQKILDSPDTKTWRGLRDRAIFEVFYSTGIRRKELLDLEIRDIDLHSQIVYIRNGKGQKQRVVPIGDSAIYWLNKYIVEVRTQQAQKTRSTALFLTYKGTKFSRTGLAHSLIPYLRAAGVKGAFHNFRHGMASAMLSNGAKITAIKEILGHDKLSSTQIYTHVAPEKLNEIYHQSCPPEEPQEDIPLPKSDKKTWKKFKPAKKQKKQKPAPIPESLDHYIEIYLSSQPEKAQVTLTKQRRLLGYFSDWCQTYQIQYIDQITHAFLEHYHKYLHQRKTTKNNPLHPNYIMRHLIAIRAFFTWLTQKKIILKIKNIAENIQLPKAMKTIPHQVLSDQEIENLLKQPNTAKPTGLRDRAIIELLRATGIKRKEFCNLTTENLNLENQTLLVNHKNPAKARTIPISHDATKWLKLYLSHSRPIIEQTPNKTLFLSNGGNPMSHVTASLRLTEYFAKAKIPKPGTFSIFRHTLAIRLLNHNADIRHVQKLLGHKELSSTQIYTKVSIRHLKQVHQETHPSEDCN